MRTLWAMNHNLDAIDEMQEYIIEKYNVKYQIFGPPHRYNDPPRADFELYIAMGDDCATHIKIFNTDAVLQDEKLQELLLKCNKKFKV